jgi:hypothetical protein
VRAAILAIVIPVSLLASPPARAQISPGALSAPHAALEGVTQCFRCHERGAGAVDAKCLDCHREIAWTRAQRIGLHARVQSTPCAKCHPDHAGRDFAMVRWDEGSPRQFDHRRAGLALEGRHARLRCEECHQTKFQTSAAAPLIRKRDRAKSWIGLATACASCHEDPHRGQLGDACERCHGQKEWKPATGFDHAKTDYPLTGRHAPVGCAKCHLSPRLARDLDARGRPLPRYKPVPHADCAPCHDDPHSGRFAGACAKCHTTQGFQTFLKGSFDHDRTRYPLRGGHAALECAKCHDPRSPAGRKPAFDRCDRCHADDHAGLATLAGRPADCAACHVVAGWTPSTYTLESHRASAYPLEGGHARVGCAECHPKGDEASAARLGRARVSLRPVHARCVDCHEDPHHGRFEPGGARPQAASCRGCHGMAAYTPTTVDAALHARLGYALEGAHRAVPCQACHAELAAPRPTAPTGAALAAAASGGAGHARAPLRPLPFAQTPTACAGCHRTPHGDQFKVRDRLGAIGADEPCEKCHGLEAFAPASRFDHERDASFRLGGAHARVRCAACHRPAPDAHGTAVVVYRGTPARCEDCHAGPAPRAVPREFPRDVPKGGRP